MAAKPCNLVGNKYGRLTVVSEIQPIIDNSGCSRRMVECVCECGNVCNKKLKYLKSGETSSCGNCIKPVVDKTSCGLDVLKVSPTDEELHLIGNKIQRLSVIEVGLLANGRRMLRVECDCGNTLIVNKGALISGHTRSCGCLMLETVSDRSKTHGMSKMPAYIVWSGMIQRCTNPNNPSYVNYGGRGIKIDESWLSFENFYKEMGDPPEELSIERLDVNGNYEKDNCLWANGSDQAVNRRKFKNNTSGRTGVVFNKRQGTWVVSLSINGDRINLGTYEDINDAIEARSSAELKYFGFNKE